MTGNRNAAGLFALRSSVLITIGVAAAFLSLIAVLRPTGPDPSTTQLVALVNEVQGLARISRKPLVEAEREKRAVVALRKIGPKAVPMILTKVRRDQQPLSVYVHKQYLRLPVRLRRLVPMAGLLDPNAAAVAISLFGPEAIHEWQFALDDEDPVIRALALQAVSYLGNRANAVLPSVAARMRDPVPKVRSAAIFALACMRPDTKTIVPDLVRVVDPDRRFQTWSGYELLLAVEMLHCLGPEAAEAAPALTKLLNEETAFGGGPLPQKNCKLAVARALNQMRSGQVVQDVRE